MSGYRQLAAIFAVCSIAALSWSSLALAQRGYIEGTQQEQSAGLPKLQEALAILDDPRRASAEEAAAVSALEAALAADPQLEDAHYNLVLLPLRKGELEAARARAQAMRSALPNRAATSAAEGLIAQAAGDRGAAETHFRKALDLDRTSPVANVYFAGKALVAKDWKEAIRSARLALVVDPGNLNAYLALATAYYETNQLELARLVCLNALGFAPNSAPLQNMLGLVLLKLDDLRGALAAFNAAIAGDSRFVEAYLNAGGLTLGYSDFQTALDHFQMVLKLEPSHRGAKLSRAVALRGLGQFDDAEAGYREVMGLGGDAYDARYNLCILHNEFTSDYQKALGICEQLESDLPMDHPKKQEMGARVKGIKTTIDALKGG